MPLTVFVRTSWMSAICGVLVLGHLLGTQPRSIEDLGLLYFLAGYLGIVVGVVAAGSGVLSCEEIVAERLQPAVIGHILSVAAILFLFILTTLPDATGLELVFVPAGFSIGQLPVMWALVARSYRSMS